MEVITENKVSSFRRFFMEYTILALVVAVVTLFALYKNLNDFVVDKIYGQNEKLIEVLQRNSDVINNFKTNNK